MDSLPKKTRRSADSIHSLAAELGIGVNTLKRLFKRGVFPDVLVTKTPGGEFHRGHWRIRNANVPELRTRLLLWTFSHRKGLNRSKTDKQSLAHSHDRQRELEKLHLALLQTQEMGFIFTNQDSERWNKAIAEERNKKKDGSHQPAHSTREQECDLTALNAEGIAQAKLLVKAAELRQKTAPSTDKENKVGALIAKLAEHMKISVSTIYRIYGKDKLRVILLPKVVVATEKKEFSKYDKKPHVLNSHSEYMGHASRQQEAFLEGLRNFYSETDSATKRQLQKLYPEYSLGRERAASKILAFAGAKQ